MNSLAQDNTVYIISLLIFRDVDSATPNCISTSRWVVPRPSLYKKMAARYSIETASLKFVS